MSLAQLRARAEAAFEAAFGAAAQASVQAPGRVNLIGEHTDYNAGFVLPCAIDRRTVIALGRRSDRRVRVRALDMSAAGDEFNLDEPVVNRPVEPWTAYVRGMVQQLLQADPALPGLDMVITGDVPQGAGLSSSASLTVAVGTAFRAAGALQDADATQLALMAQRAENLFVGCQCGIMDQLVSARGRDGHALLIDCRSLEARPVALPEGVSVLIAHSRVERGLVDSQYNERRLACERAARHFEVPALRDVTAEQLSVSTLDPLTLRRARHVVTENDRTVQAAQALEQGRLPDLARLMAESHASMRDDFEITVPAVDRLVQIISTALGGAGGCRMTGGGFGGCVVAVMPAECVALVQSAVRQHYRSPQGLEAQIFVCAAGPGAGLVTADAVSLVQTPSGLFIDE